MLSTDFSPLIGENVMQNHAECYLKITAMPFRVISHGYANIVHYVQACDVPAVSIQDFSLITDGSARGNKHGIICHVIHMC